MYTSQEDIVSAIEGLADARYGNHNCDNLKKLLLSYDGNGDGALDHGELASLLGDAGSCGFLGCGYFANKILDQLDRDSTGSITWDEYLAVSSSCAPSAPAADAPGAPGAPAASGPHGITGFVNHNIDSSGLDAVKNATSKVDDVANVKAPKADDEMGTGTKVAIGAGALGLLYFLFR